MATRLFSDFLSRLRKGVGENERARLASILELNRALAAAQDLDGLLNMLLDEAIRLFGAERGFVVLTDASSEPFRVAAARSLDREPVRAPKNKISSTVVRHCLDQGQGVFSEDAQAGDLGAGQSIADLNLRSVLCAPVSVGEETFGCIYLDHRFQSKVFGADDLPWFHAFADQCAISLHLHRLLEANRSRTKVVEARNQDLSERVAQQAEELSQLQLDLSRTRLQHEYPEIIGEAPALMRSLHLLDRVVDSEFPVMITGESGTGKELAARALHRCGKRSSGPFVAVNIASINHGLLESELFGHRKGAFTGADRDRLGLFQQAHGGVLFLDEVTEMDLGVQAKLLRMLENGSVRPVGSDQEVSVDVRIVAATNRIPALEVEEGRFRRDLYYRLAVVSIDLPPLRQRLADVEMLVGHFLRQAADTAGRDLARRATQQLLREVAARGWPGNLRQLRNEVLRMDALAEGDVVGPELLSPETDSAPEGPELNLQRLERWAIHQALEGTGGNKSEAARLLGISRRAPYNKLGRETNQSQ